MPHLDFTQPPFDVLRSTERQSLKKNTQVRYLGANESLASDDLHNFFVVLKGQIDQMLAGEFVASYFGSNHSDQLNSNDWFDSRRTPESQGRIVKSQNDGNTEPYQYTAHEDTLLLQIDGAAIDKISAQNHLVRQLLSDKLPERLKALQQRRSMQGQALGACRKLYCAARSTANHATTSH